ncbi:RAM signaling network component [Salix suchowensis]|nr:RAM signaling network component [Salix suchowensis]
MPIYLAQPPRMRHHLAQMAYMAIRPSNMAVHHHTLTSTALCSERFDTEAKYARSSYCEIEFYKEAARWPSTDEGGVFHAFAVVFAPGFQLVPQLEHRAASAEASSSKLGPGPSMAFERNSYFRRLSTLPTAVSTVLPQPLLCLIDSARSILFAVCQVYLALEHYTVQATDDRLPNVLRKVLDPANSDMMHFINSLDRFDAMSRKMLPPPAICRAVVESCKDTVSVFGKAMGVLALQLKMLAHEDVRYLRSLLLTLYGATAEISCAWAGMAPHIEAIKPLLYAKPPSSNHLAAISNSEVYPLSAPVTKSTHGHEGSGAFPLRSANGTTGVVRARRHAGSFSSKDVEIEALRPSHSRQGSQASLQGSSTSSSPLVAPKPSLSDLVSTSNVQVDNEVLNAMQEAIDVAPSVWEMMEEILADVINTDTDVREGLARAKAITTRLLQTLRAFQDGDFTTADKRAMGEDARIFCNVSRSIFYSTSQLS